MQSLHLSSSDVSQLRKAVPEDLPEAQRMWSDYYDEHPLKYISKDGMMQIQTEVFQSILEDGQGICMIAPGVSIVMARSMGHGVVEDYGAYVAPQWRSQRVGAEMLERAFSELKSAGFKRVLSYPYVEDVRVQKWAIDQGFRPIQVIMAKEL